ncbi:MAG TPA: hypothetical protein VF341_02990, partial [Anaeromyxobacteraceae bacterium]
LLGAALALAGLAACGSDSSGQAQSLLKQTFSGPHKVQSGNLTVNLTMTPSGSTTLTGPVSLSFGGPFQSRGTGKLPESAFTVTVSALGKTGSLGLLSTGDQGYVSLQGTSYQLPAATCQRLESSFSGLTSSAGGSGANSGALSKLGIDPLKWLTNPTIVGSDTIGGADTTHIRAGINVAVLLGDLNTFLQKASSLGVPNASKVPSNISESTRNKVASTVQHPSVDVWTGKSDKTARKVTIQLTLPVTGQVSSVLGGLHSAQIALTLEYANLNQPQTITAPTTLRPFNEFTAKIQGLAQSLQGALGGIAGGAAGAGSTGSTGATGGSAGATGTTGSSSGVQSYAQCIQAAGNDISKMQGCAKLLNNGG